MTIVLKTKQTKPHRSLTNTSVVAKLVIAIGIFSATLGHAQNFDEWGAAVSVDPLRIHGVNTSANDGCPIEAPDGHMLFFASDRSGDLDIWMAYREKDSDDWGSVVPLPGPVNTSANEFCPTPLPGNGLLFVSTRANNCGGTGNNPDIYFTRLHPVKGWLPPTPLSCDVNSSAEEWSPSLVEADGVTLLFFSSTRTGTQKIYMSSLLPDGTWSAATPVSELNRSGAQDARPNVRKDGLEIVFDSTRGGGAPDIYTASRVSIYDPWSTPVALGANVNSPTFGDTRASFSRDGERLYFGSGRANQMGDRGGDIFVSTRIRLKD
jgi:Tol biopolymer transport system component